MKKMMTGLMFMIILTMVFMSGCSSDKTDSKQTKEPEQTTKESNTDEKAKGELEEKETEEEPETEVEEEVEPESAEETEVVPEEKEDTQDGDGEFISETFEGITFNVPDYAQKGDPGQQALPLVMFYLDPAIGSNFNVVMEPLPKSLKIKEYIDIATTMTGFEYLSNEYYTSNGIEWNECVSLTHSEQATVKLNQRTFIIDKKAYIFTYAALPETYENNLEDFITITESVLLSNQ